MEKKQRLREMEAGDEWKRREEWERKLEALVTAHVSAGVAWAEAQILQAADQGRKHVSLCQYPGKAAPEDIVEVLRRIHPRHSFDLMEKDVLRSMHLRYASELVENDGKEEQNDDELCLVFGLPKTK